jgi:BlaI family penicillinase repressor
MTAPAKNLSDVQLSIMTALWQIQKGSVADVLAVLKDKSYARTTVATMLTRLEKQQFVTCKKEQGGNVYYPLVEQQEVQQSSISQLLKNFFGDRKSNLVSFLLDQDVTEQELQQVREMLDKKQQKQD